MSIFSFLFGGKPRQRQIPRYTPQQESMLNQLLSRGMEKTDTGALEEMYKNQFQQEIVPGIAEQFTSIGGQGGSGFEDALRRGGTDLMSQLAALRFQGGQQALGHGLMQQFDTVEEEGAPGLLNSIAGPILGGLMAGMRGSGGRQVGGGGGNLAPLLQALAGAGPAAGTGGVGGAALGGLGGLGVLGGLGALLGQGGQKQASPTGGAGQAQYFPGQPQGYLGRRGRTPSYWDTMFGSGF